MRERSLLSRCPSYNVYYISLRWGGTTLLADTDHLYLILMLLKYKITHTVYYQGDN
jgi:hypothetical protein